MKLAKRLSLIIVPALLMLLLIYLLRGGKDILEGLFFYFPLIYVALGLLCADFVKELVISMGVTTLAFLLPVNLCFNMGTCIDCALVYVALGCAAYFVKRRVLKRVRK